MQTKRNARIDGIVRLETGRNFLDLKKINRAKLDKNVLILKKEGSFNYPGLNFERAGGLLAKNNFSLDGIRIHQERPAVIKTFDDYSSHQQTDMYGTLKDRYESLTAIFRDAVRGSLPRVNLVHAWNFSIVTSIIFGMFLMTMVYRYLGRSASAGTVEIDMRPVKKELVEEKMAKTSQSQAVLGAESAKSKEEREEKTREDLKKNALEKELKEMTAGFPIEKMIPYIKEKDKKTAAFLVGIAKKESNWGKSSPKLKGQDCFNYWGYKSIKGEDSSGDYTCFDNPEEAVDIVGKRMETFINKKNLTDPGKMVTAWKCGYDCSWDDPGAVKKWVSDVKMYYDEIMKAG